MVGYRSVTLVVATMAVIAGILTARVELVGVRWLGAILAVCVVVSGGLLWGLRFSDAKFNKNYDAVRWEKKKTGIIRWLGIFSLYLGFACLGGLRYFQVNNLYPADHIVHCCGPQRRLASLRGVIVTKPYLAKSRDDFGIADFLCTPQTIFSIRCEQVRAPDGWKPISGLVRVVIDQPCVNLQQGRQIEVDGWLSRPQGPGNPGQPDRRDSYHAARTLVLCRVNYAEAIRVLSPEKSREGWFGRFRYRLADMAHSTLIEPDDFYQPGRDDSQLVDAKAKVAFLEALLLGRRQHLQGDLSEIFMRTGTMHYLSVSGFHVGLLAGFVWWLARLIRLGRTGQGLLALAAVAWFIFVVPERPPILRAGLICMLFCLGYILRRKVDAVNLLTLAALVLLLWRPLDLFSAGFQLSFVVVLGILVFVRDFYHRIYHPEGEIIIDDPEKTFWQVALSRTGRFVVSLVLVAVVAWLVGMPLVAYHFNRITPWAPLAAVVIFPLICLTMFVGFAKLLIAAILPTAAGLLNGPMELLSGGTISAARLMGELPFCCINTASPPVWLILIYCGLLILAGWSLGRTRSLTDNALVGTAAFVGRSGWSGRGKTFQQSRGGNRLVWIGLTAWFIWFAWSVPFDKQAGTTRIDVLDVGHGCSTVIRLSDGRIFCYDAGSMTKSNVGTFTIVPFLRSVGVQKLDGLFISHPNLDHYSGVLELCRCFDVGRIYICDYFEKTGDNTSNKLLTKLSELGVAVQYLSRDRSLKAFGITKESSCLVEVLWPPGDLDSSTLNSNDSSLVVRFRDEFGSILLCGDIGEQPQRMLMEMESENNLKADVLLMPHHGAVRDTLPEFVARVDPQLCLNSCGRGREYLCERLKTAIPAREVLHTFQNGAVQVQLLPEGLVVEKFIDEN
ncbi:MAG: ComEC/Rec2 family competence protein [Sedimentisphaerales bacterium]|nr:ComEC/Rec2 family competence protein [Sedimentisphaerales bacterium]